MCYNIVANNINQQCWDYTDDYDLETHQISPELLSLIIKEVPRTKAWDDYLILILINNNLIDHMEYNIDHFDLSKLSDDNSKKVEKWIYHDFPSVTTEDLIKMYDDGHGHVAYNFKEEWEYYLRVFDFFKKIESHRLMSICMENRDV